MTSKEFIDLPKDIDYRQLCFVILLSIAHGIEHPITVTAHRLRYFLHGRERA